MKKKLIQLKLGKIIFFVFCLDSFLSFVYLLVCFYHRFIALPWVCAFFTAQGYFHVSFYTSTRNDTRELTNNFMFIKDMKMELTMKKSMFITIDLFKAGLLLLSFSLYLSPFKL